MKTSEEMKKKLNEMKEAQDKEEQEKKLALQADEEAKKLAQLAANANEDKKNPESDVIPAALYELVKNKLTDEDLKALDDDFDKEYGADKRKGNKLEFASDEEAINFFQRQAKEGRQFLAKKEGQDKYAYSDGSGVLFVGTEAELTQHLKGQNNTPFNFEPKPEAIKKEEEDEENRSGMSP